MSKSYFFARYIIAAKSLVAYIEEPLDFCIIHGVSIPSSSKSTILAPCESVNFPSFSNISITSISRQGKNAIYMKFMPIDYYKQIIYKSTPQIIINAIFILILLIVINAVFPLIKFIYNLYIFLIANLLNIFNSMLMVFIDLNNPNLDWNAEYEVISNNNKKIYQYALTILVILLLTYFSKIFINLNINLSCILVMFILLIILSILNIIIIKNKNKLFKKIN